MSVSSVQFTQPLPFPKILKKDIRRLYADMFSNVTNSADMQLTECFFKEFTRKNLDFTQSCVASKIPGMCEEPELIQLNGLNVFLQFWYNQQQMAPDICWRTSNTKIVSLMNSKESRVEFDFELRLTCMYYLQYGDVVPTLEEQEVIVRKESSTIITSKKRKATDSSTLQENHKYNDRFVLQIRAAEMRAEPMEMRMKGQMSMHLDGNKMITKMHFNGLEKQFYSHGIFVGN
jgi:hypothetical protein